MKADIWKTATILMVLSLLNFGISTVYPQERGRKFSIGGFYPGQNVGALKNLGMPFPLDTGGWHTFLNQKENVYCRFFLEKRNNRWIISQVHLVKSGGIDRGQLLNDHLMLTGVSLLKYTTRKKIGIGSVREEIIKKYDSPEKKLSIDSGEALIYKYKDGRGGYYRLIFIINNGRVEGIRSSH